MRQLTMHLLTAIALATMPPTAASAQGPEARAAKFVVGELNDATDELSDKRWIIRQGFIGHVDERSRFSHTIRTDQASTFLVKGYCDTDCTDMDLELVSASGQVLIADNSVDDTPELRFTASQVGGQNAIVRVKMYNCSTRACYYSVGLFSR